MATRTTEQLHPDALGFDMLPLEQAAKILSASQVAASNTSGAAVPAISAGARAMARTIRAGGVLRYVAAGSSGLMAAADALELNGTFSIQPAQIRIHMAGGQPVGVEMPGDTEDCVDALAEELKGIAAQDTVIAVSASGSTPYTLAAAEIAKTAGAHVIGIANNSGSALLTLADSPITLATPPEVIAGSTRMGAGTAQKIALTMLATLMAVELGHVHDGMMINVKADNIKLRQRARDIVSRVSSTTQDTAAKALETACGEVKPAILIAAGATTLAQARSLLEASNGHLRSALTDLLKHT